VLQQREEMDSIQLFQQDTKDEEGEVMTADAAVSFMYGAERVTR
jgi:hypothetical protein